MAGNATAAQVALGPDWGSLGWHVTSRDPPEQLTHALPSTSFPFCLGRAKGICIHPRRWSCSEVWDHEGADVTQFAQPPCSGNLALALPHTALTTARRKASSHCQKLHTLPITSNILQGTLITQSTQGIFLFSSSSEVIPPDIDWLWVLDFLPTKQAYIHSIPGREATLSGFPNKPRAAPYQAAALPHSAPILFLTPHKDFLAISSWK